MKILIAYASTEGQTRKIARFCADTLVDDGHSVELMPVADAGAVEPARFDAAILAASVHVGRYQDEMVEFARAHAQALAGLRTLFLSVSLAAAGTDPEEHADLDRIAAAFAETTGWTPGRVEQVAGAFRFTEYDFFKAWAMRWIAHQKGEAVDPRGDREYTDWAALESVLSDWAG
ncbi:flavodoxin domain-containing protein [Roseovarius salinarum]|uniref:flavodoxin domain-containing protein n=1 Tax=Roseovarius salinarum TaxID=1981892 RepID=UPI000C338DEF|nr:flavodoxin domain-containing protein [Roseovarius salinarum]